MQWHCEISLRMSNLKSLGARAEDCLQLAAMECCQTLSIFSCYTWSIHFKTPFFPDITAVCNLLRCSSSTAITKGNTPVSVCSPKLSPVGQGQCRSKGNISGGARERRRHEPLEGSEI